MRQIMLLPKTPYQSRQLSASFGVSFRFSLHGFHIVLEQAVRTLIWTQIAEKRQKTVGNRELHQGSTDRSHNWIRKARAQTFIPHDQVSRPGFWCDMQDDLHRTGKHKRVFLRFLQSIPQISSPRTADNSTIGFVSRTG